jgi:hypothetical protein
MPKLTGPFMSLSASGTLGKTLTASIWKGQPYMRLRVIPINRNSVGQKTVRSVLGTLAKACRAVLTSFNDTENPATGSQFFVDAVAVAPAGQSWISYLQKVSNAEFAGNVTSYGALDSTHKGYWSTTSATLGMSSYIDKMGVTHTAGEQLYMLAKFAVGYLTYDAFATTVDAAVQIEVTAFGVYVQDSISA